MAWEKSRDKWLKGNIQPKEDKNDVIGWIQNDPIWKRADKITLKPSGSHEGTIYIRGISSVVAQWDADIFNVSNTGGRWIKKWQLEQLVKGYRELMKLPDN